MGEDADMESSKNRIRKNSRKTQYYARNTVRKTNNLTDERVSEVSKSDPMESHSKERDSLGSRESRRYSNVAIPHKLSKRPSKRYNSARTSCFLGEFNNRNKSNGV